MDFLLDPLKLWSGLGYPLVRLMCFISIGLFIANLIEALNWTRSVARVAEPLAKLGHLSDITGASFSMAFFSGVAANTMLAEAYDKNKLTKRELVLSNLFNSLPTYFLHLPTMFFITLPFIGSAAVVYVGLTLFAALLRTLMIVLMGRVLLPPLPEHCVICRLDEQQATTWKEALHKSWVRFKKRIQRIAKYTVPIYCLFYVLTQTGVFAQFQDVLASVLGESHFLPPDAMSIVVFHVAAEFTAGLAAAGALLSNQTLEVHQIVMALFVGNILSSPMRALRHQFPYYAGIFKPKLAMNLIIFSQLLRTGSIALVAFGYYLVMF